MSNVRCQVSNVQKKGFTLVELLVVIALIVFITGLTLINLRTGADILVLERAAHRVAQDMRRTMEFTLRSQAFADCGGSDTLAGYGIRFNSAQPNCYLIYAECNDNATYQGVECDGTGSGPDKAVEAIELEKGVQIQSINPSPKFNILFIPPDPEILINNKKTPGTQAVVTLELENDATKTRTVTISIKGVVDID